MEYREMRAEKSIVCFIILHYMNTEDTKECVDSILNLEEKDYVRIIIVDNASPNGSGKQLAGFYKEQRNVYVLCRETNEGFSKGNNAGVTTARERWNPDFYVVANNDIVFCQKDFISRLWKGYEKHRFDVMGPDIYVPNYDIHQNPMQMDPPTMHQVQNTIKKNALLQFFLPIFYRKIRKRLEQGRREFATDYQTFCTNVCLKGACTIYSRNYVEEREKLFYPETFFYYEEFIQAAYCRKNNKTVIYDPNLKVIHKDGSAIAESKKESYSRCKFMLKVIGESAKIYREYIMDR